MALDRNKEVIEAIRRMPKHLQDERQARQTRALYLDARKQILPKDQWTKPEEVSLNEPHRDKPCLRGFPTRSDINHAVQPQ